MCVLFPDKQHFVLLFLLAYLLSALDWFCSKHVLKGGLALIFCLYFAKIDLVKSRGGILLKREILAVLEKWRDVLSLL